PAISTPSFSWWPATSIEYRSTTERQLNLWQEWKCWIWQLQHRWPKSLYSSTTYTPWIALLLLPRIRQNRLLCYLLKTYQFARNSYYVVLSITISPVMAILARK